MRGWLSTMLLASAVTACAAADAAVTPLRFGMSTALSGPASDLGRDMRAGVQAAFEEVNESGGVQGRSLDLIVMDDGYEPSRTAPNMRRLIDDSRVLAVVGNVGTPTAVVAVPIATASKTPFVGAFTGAGVLRKTPPDRYVINFRASYAQETAAMVQALLEHGVRPDEVAFFTQRDAYGAAGFSSGVAALERVQPGVGARVAHGRYRRNTLAVEGALAELLMHEPEPRAVIMVGAYAPCARFIRLAHEVGFRPHFLNLSFVGGDSLARELGPHGDGVIITQVTPNRDQELPLVVASRRALDAANAPVTPGSIEGFAVGRLVIEALRRIDGDISRESLTDALESLGTFDLGMGTQLELSPQRRQASDRVWPNQIRGGRVVSIDWADALLQSGAER